MEQFIPFVQMLLVIFLSIAAINQWIRNGQSVRKKLGFTFHFSSLGDFGAGLLITAIAMLGIFFVELQLSGIRVVGSPFRITSLDDKLGFIVFYGIVEEFFFRSLLLSGLVVALGQRKWLAIFISAALFGLNHLGNPGASYISAFGNALGGIIYGMAFLGGKNFWLPLGLHLSWNFTQGPILGFYVSGVYLGGLLTLKTTGSDLLTGGAYGPEAGLVGMAFRFVIMAMVYYYLQWRCQGRGNLKSLEFPIKVYENPHKG
jgi:membrane protease YdiL (CAAX protease family)